MAARGEGGRRPGEGSSDRRTAAFTLVELLVVIVIIALLAAMSLAALYASQQSARATHTRALITKLDQALAPRWESYRTRRLPIEINTAGGETEQQFRTRRLKAQRELMRKELPNFYYDIIFMPVALLDTNGNAFNPSLTLAYQRRIQAINPAETDINVIIDTLRRENQTAECLYMILTTGMGDDSAVDLTFRPREVADTDGDGMPEFVDGWGTPIEWIRWPAGFRSELQPFRPDPSDPTNPSKFRRDPNQDHDPFDFARVDTWDYTTPPPRAYELRPLIMSAGPDGSGSISTSDPITDTRTHAFGVFFNTPANAGNESGAMAKYNLVGVSSDPYQMLTDSQGVDRQRGELMPGNYRASGLGPGDNIHNHLLDARR